MIVTCSLGISLLSTRIRLTRPANVDQLGPENLDCGLEAHARCKLPHVRMRPYAHDRRYDSGQDRLSQERTTCHSFGCLYAKQFIQ